MCENPDWFELPVYKAHLGFLPAIKGNFLTSQVSDIQERPYTMEFVMFYLLGLTVS